WGLIWFGVILTINMEMALITPPVGLNLFVGQRVVRDVPHERIIRGALPYALSMVAVLALVAPVPQLAAALDPGVRWPRWPAHPPSRWWSVRRSSRSRSSRWRR